MIEMLLSVVGQRGVDALAFLLAFVLTALMDSVFHDKLPHDHGREFAVNGGLSKGKARGSGLIFVLCIALVSLAFLPFRVTPLYISGSSTFPFAVRLGIRLKPWKMKPISLLRISESSSSDRLETSLPSMRYSPLVQMSSRPSMFISVDLPEPE